MQKGKNNALIIILRVREKTNIQWKKRIMFCLMHELNALKLLCIGNGL